MNCDGKLAARAVQFAENRAVCYPYIILWSARYYFVHVFAAMCFVAARK